MPTTTATIHQPLVFYCFFLDTAIKKYYNRKTVKNDIDIFSFAVNSVLETKWKLNGEKRNWKMWDSFAKIYKVK